MMTAQRDLRLPPSRMLWFAEPKLRFAHDQLLEDPKDGLLLFGPPPEAPAGISYGVVGTATGIRQLEAWSSRLAQSIAADPKVPSSVTFPGFETLFRVAWPSKARVSWEVDDAKLQTAIRISDPHQRVCAAVDLYADEIRRWVDEEDAKVNFWFVVVPEELWKRCRPKSTVTKEEAVARL